MDQVPVELTLKPTPLVGLVGCQALHSSIIQLITGAASPSNDKYAIFGDGSRLRLRIYGFDDQIVPKRKDERRSTYELYKPHGIFKSNWLRKHIYEIPAVVTLLFEWDDEQDWRQRETAIASQIEKIRPQAKSRNSKIVLVLVQNKKTPAGDHTAEERMTSLRKRCDVDSKSIVLFPTVDITAACRRLEKVLFDVAAQRYKEEGRRVKHHKETVSKKTQQHLYARHHFKIAFFAECRGEIKSALKYYNSAYNFIREVNDSVYSLHEIKAVAEFIHFKLCSLYFSHSVVHEAIDQFRHHIRHFKREVGVRDLEFQHWAWVSKQYLVFGQMLQTLPRSTNLNDLWQHPGFYYQAAATASIERRKKAHLLGVKRFSGSVADMLAPKPEGEPVFVGQRAPQAQGEGSARVPSAVASVAERIRVAQQEEANFEHSPLIIDLLTKAYDQFKHPVRRDRTQSHLLALMGQEYAVAQKFEQAKQIFDRILALYRKEQWWSIITSILTHSLECAYRLGNHKDYIEHALDLMSPELHNKAEEKQEVLKNLVRFLTADTGDDAFFSALKEPLTVDLARDSLWASCACHFVRPTVCINEEIEFVAEIKISTPLPIRFNKLEVFFSDPACNYTLEDGPHTDYLGALDDSAERSLEFQPSVPKVFRIKFAAQACRELESTHVKLHLGTAPAALVFCFNLGDHNRRSTLASEEQASTRAVERPFVGIVQPKSKLSVRLQHSAPALVNESYKITIRLNSEDAISEGTMHLVSDEENLFSDASGAALSQIEVGNIAANEEKVLEIFARSTRVCESLVQIKILYTTGQNHKAMFEDTLPLSFILPFRAAVRFSTPHMLELTPTTIGEDVPLQLESDVQLHAELECLTPYDLWLDDVGLELASANETAVAKLKWEPVGDNKPTALLARNKTSLQKGAKVTACFVMSPLVAGAHLPLGSLKLVWRRADQDGPATTGNLVLPHVHVERPAFTVTCDVADHGRLGQPMPMRITLLNNTDQLHTISLSASEGEGFLFAGYASAKFQLVPGRPQELHFNLIPLLSGQIPLPKVSLVSTRTNKRITDIMQHRNVFVVPVHQ